MSDLKTYLQREPNLKLGKKLKILTWILTAAVLILVGLMRTPGLAIPLPEGVSMAFLPPIHALLNSIVAISLIMAVWMIKRENICAHKAWIGLAMACSVLFLLCYVAYHFTTEETKFPVGEPLRGLYLFILITHIVLAGVSLPFILMTWLYGFTNQFTKHKKMAKWVFPVWFYVAATGPICYFMLKPYY
jgi:putative membrane protein